jgi:exo-beta-1,3-glucanase (GH17 family)
MKTSITLLSTALLSLLSFSAFSDGELIHGINYDPAHTNTYLNAQNCFSDSRPKDCSLATMGDEIDKDIRLMRNTQIKVIKTFYAQFTTQQGASAGVIRIADKICAAGFKIMIGVYEFRPTDGSWYLAGTQEQVDAAIKSAQDHPDCVVGIAVGSEDITNWNFTEEDKDMQGRIIADIKQIKGALGNKVPVGSPQQDGAWIKLYKDNPANPLIAPGLLDFIGANIYPYWDSNRPNWDETGKQQFTQRLQAIHSAFPNQKIIITEEGWPSSNSPSQNPHTSIAIEKEYYNDWIGNKLNPSDSSYYFGMFDKLPEGSGGADDHFGLCNSERGNKQDSDGPIINCQ